MNQNNEMLCFNSLDSFDRLADALCKSGFGLKDKAQAFALMAIAQSEGIHPARAAMEYHIIKGKPSLKAEAMLARFQKAGGIVEWIKREDDIVSAKFSHPSSSPLEVSWDTKRAIKAQLLNQNDKNSNWNKYPRQMLTARVISEGIRAVYPAVLVGFYTPEEIKDFKEEDFPNKKSETKVKHEDHIDAEYEEIQEENNAHNFDSEATIKEIQACNNIHNLKEVFAKIHRTIKSSHYLDQSIIDKIIAEKDNMKAKLSIIEEKNKNTDPIYDAANGEEMETAIVGMN